MYRFENDRINALLRDEMKLVDKDFKSSTLITDLSFILQHSEMLINNYTVIHEHINIMPDNIKNSDDTDYNLNNELSQAIYYVFKK